MASSSSTFIVLQILQICSFGLQQVDYLGHQVSGNGVAMDSEKLQTVRKWPRLVNLKDLRGFFGFN